MQHVQVDASAAGDGNAALLENRVGETHVVHLARVRFSPLIVLVVVWCRHLRLPVSAAQRCAR